MARGAGAGGVAARWRPSRARLELAASRRGKGWRPGRGRGRARRAQRFDRVRGERALGPGAQGPASDRWWRELLRRTAPAPRWRAAATRAQALRRTAGSPPRRRGAQTIGAPPHPTPPCTLHSLAPRTHRKPSTGRASLGADRSGGAARALARPRAGCSRLTAAAIDHPPVIHGRPQTFLELSTSFETPNGLAHGRRKRKRTRPARAPPARRRPSPGRPGRGSESTGDFKASGTARCAAAGSQRRARAQRRALAPRPAAAARPAPPATRRWPRARAAARRGAAPASWRSCCSSRPR
jgi:hypothetical protein